MSEFTLVATGGTFDIIHRGHLTLLSDAFAISDKIIIGMRSLEILLKLLQSNSQIVFHIC